MQDYPTEPEMSIKAHRYKTRFEKPLSVKRRTIKFTNLSLLYKEIGLNIRRENENFCHPAFDIYAPSFVWLR
jgi:hypothetical protein